jgi:hypothetical protein
VTFQCFKSISYIEEVIIGVGVNVPLHAVSYATDEQQGFVIVFIVVGARESWISYVTSEF